MDNQKKHSTQQGRANVVGVPRKHLSDLGVRLAIATILMVSIRPIGCTQDDSFEQEESMSFGIDASDQCLTGDAAKNSIEEGSHPAYEDSKKRCRFIEVVEVHSVKKVVDIASVIQCTYQVIATIGSVDPDSECSAEMGDQLDGEIELEVDSDASCPAGTDAEDAILQGPLYSTTVGCHSYWESVKVTGGPTASGSDNSYCAYKVTTKYGECTKRSGCEED